METLKLKLKTKNHKTYHFVAKHEEEWGESNQPKGIYGGKAANKHNTTPHRVSAQLEQFLATNLADFLYDISQIKKIK